MPTIAATETGYRNLWSKSYVKPERVAAANAIADKIIANRAQYEEVQRRTGVPWFWLGVIHVRESNMNFKGVLHNGQAIIGTGKKTTIVPVGHGPFTTWSEAAIDAINLKGLQKIKSWSGERVLFEAERWNGWGYLGKGNSPYIWSWTNLYVGGKYVRDGVYDPNHVDVQPGCAALLKALCAKSPDVAKVMAIQDSNPPKDVIDSANKEATVTERNTVGGAAAGGATTGGVVAVSDGPSFLYAYVLPLGIAVFLAVAIVAIVRIRQKKVQLQQRWGAPVQVVINNQTPPPTPPSIDTTGG